MYKGEYTARFIDVPISAATREIVARREIAHADMISCSISHDEIIQSLRQGMCHDICNGILESKQYSITETTNQLTPTTTVEMRVNVAGPRCSSVRANEKVCKIGGVTFSMSEVREALENTFPEQFI